MTPPGCVRRRSWCWSQVTDIIISHHVLPSRSIDTYDRDNKAWSSNFANYSCAYASSCISKVNCWHRKHSFKQVGAIPNGISATINGNRGAISSHQHRLHSISTAVWVLLIFSRLIKWINTVGSLSSSANFMVASGNIQNEGHSISAGRTAMTKSLHIWVF